MVSEQVIVSEAIAKAVQKQLEQQYRLWQQLQQKDHRVAGPKIGRIAMK